MLARTASSAGRLEWTSEKRAIRADGLYTFKWLEGQATNSSTGATGPSPQSFSAGSAWAVGHRRTRTVRATVAIAVAHRLHLLSPGTDPGRPFPFAGRLQDG